MMANDKSLAELRVAEWVKEPFPASAVALDPQLMAAVAMENYERLARELERCLDLLEGSATGESEGELFVYDEEARDMLREHGRTP